MPLVLDGTTGVVQGNLATGVAGTGPAFSAYKTAAQALTSGTTTKVTFDAEEFDTAGAFASSRWTPGVAGIYSISATALMSAASVPAVVILELWVTGAAHARLFQENGPNSGLMIAGGSKLVQLSATDYVEVYASISATSPEIGGQATAPRWSHFSGFLARAA